jgi:hypothetical protein
MMVRPARFELATYGFVVRRSIRAELRARLLFDRKDVNRTMWFACQLFSDPQIALFNILGGNHNN